MGLPDPSRRIQRTAAFRRIPGGARNCSQHPFGPALEAGRWWDPRPFLRPGRQETGDLRADVQGRRNCSQFFSRFASGARNGAMAAWRSSLRTGATAGRCERFASLSHDGRELSSAILPGSTAPASAPLRTAAESSLHPDDVIAKRPRVVERVCGTLLFAAVLKPVNDTSETSGWRLRPSAPGPVTSNLEHGDVLGPVGDDQRLRPSRGNGRVHARRRRTHPRR